MSEGSRTSGLNRREFFSVGALPLVAALAPANLARQYQPSRQEVVRVGIIGAGSNVQAVQIPGFRRIPSCEIVAVANRSLESSQRVADDFNIPRAYANWAELLEDDEVDAVLIGTWPYMHRILTVACLEKGKHVLCQSRLANTAGEAREMLEASQRYPHLVCQLVPAGGYRTRNVLTKLIGDGHVGEVLSAEIQRLRRSFADFGGEPSWRQSLELSGFNTLNLGLGATYETTTRVLGRATRVMAMSKVHVPYRRDVSGQLTSVTIPDHVDILYELANGAQVHMRFSSTTGLSSGNRMWIYGTEGTIYLDANQNVFAGRRGDSELLEVPNPPEERTYYRVEEEFINAIRGIEQVSMTTFEVGVHYMEWTDAVFRSSQTGQAVHLPL